MGFSAVARVTAERWIAYAVRDEIAFGLIPGGELQVATTICDEIRGSGELAVIDHVAESARRRGSLPNSSTDKRCDIVSALHGKAQDPLSCS